MRAIHFKASLIRSGLAAAVLLVAATASYAQTTVGLTAAPTQAVLPDGQSVPMWGYTCDAASVTAGTRPLASGGTQSAISGTPATRAGIAVMSTVEG